MNLLDISQMSQEELFMEREYDPKTRDFSSEQFDEVAAKFPKCLFEFYADKSMPLHGPGWGHAWYKKDENTGMIELFRENWDTSG